MLQPTRRADDDIGYTNSTAASVAGCIEFRGTRGNACRAKGNICDVDGDGFRAVSRIQAKGGRHDATVARQHSHDSGRRNTSDACGKGQDRGKTALRGSVGGLYSIWDQGVSSSRATSWTRLIFRVIGCRRGHMLRK